VINLSILIFEILCFVKIIDINLSYVVLFRDMLAGT